MGKEIKSRPFQFGDENEAAWPPRYGTGGTGSYYWDQKKHKFVSGAPPAREVYDTAPFVISDSLKGAFYHHGACKWTDSRSELRAIDKATGCITTDKQIPADPSEQRRLKRERREDGTKALLKSVAQIDAGTAPISEELQAKCDIQNEVISNALNMDAFNVVGKKNNAKGKRFKRFRR